MLFKDGDVIMFAGDSTTDDGRARPFAYGNKNLGNGYVRLVDSLLAVLYPEYNYRIFNSGNSGNTSRYLLARWDEDILSQEPDWISIMIGINDIWRQMDLPQVQFRHVNAAEYRENLTKMVEKSLPTVKGIIIMPPFFMEPLHDDMMRKMTDEYHDIAKEVAESHGCIFADVQECYDEYLKYKHSSSISWDRVHPGITGCFLVMKAFLKAIEVDRPLY
jgi:lysophospholipase L1-like esterase